MTALGVIRDRSRSGPSPELLLGVGLAVWLIAFAALAAPTAARILLLAPLVIVPRVLAGIPFLARMPSHFGAPTLAAAVALAFAFACPPGPAAVALALPWLLVTVALGIAGAARGFRLLADVETMVRTHGALDALAVLLASVTLRSVR